MGTLKEEAQGYVPKQTKNISELDKVPVDLELYDGKGINKKGESFEYKYAKLNGEDYRVPNSVLEQIQSMLIVREKSKMPELQFVKVTAKGTGQNVKYTVVALD